MAQPINDGSPDGAFFTYDNLYLLWEFYAAAVDELIFTTVSSVVAVTAVCLLFVPHWSAVMFIFPLISVVYIDLLGTCLLSYFLIVFIISFSLRLTFLMHLSLLNPKW